MMLQLLLLALGAASVQNPAPNPVQAPAQPPQVIDRKSNNSPEYLRTYEMRDFLPKVLRKSRELKGLGYVGESVEDFDAESLKQQQSLTAFLTDLITREVQPPATSAQWSLRITPSGTLVLHAVPAQHEWVQAFLERNRTKEQLVFVESCWIEGPKGAFQRMGIAAGASATVLERKDRERLLAGCKDDARFAVIVAPRLLVDPLATGTLYVGETIAYVKSFKVETVQPGDVQIADPEIGRIEEGFQMQATGWRLEDRKLALDLTASDTAVRRPIPTKNVRLAPDNPTEVTIAMPEVERKSVQVRCTLAPEGTVAFCAPVAGHEEREFLILVSARAMTPAELQALPKDLPARGATKNDEKPK